LTNVVDGAAKIEQRHRIFGVDRGERL